MKLSALFRDDRVTHIAGEPTEFGKELQRQWARRDAAMKKIHAALEEKTGIPADLIPHMPHEYVTLAAILGVRVE